MINHVASNEQKRHIVIVGYNKIICLKMNYLGFSI